MKKKKKKFKEAEPGATYNRFNSIEKKSIMKGKKRGAGEGEGGGGWGWGEVDDGGDGGGGGGGESQTFQLDLFNYWNGNGVATYEPLRQLNK